MPMALGKLHVFQGYLEGSTAFQWTFGVTLFQFQCSRGCVILCSISPTHMLTDKMQRAVGHAKFRLNYPPAVQKREKTEFCPQSEA